MILQTIEDGLRWMNSQKTKIQREGLDKIKCALEYVGNPQQDLTVIHIGGTNGKGSTTAYLQRLFLEHQVSVGTFTSPHMMKFNERITFNGEMIDDDSLLDLINQMVVVNDYMRTTSYGPLVFFELYTVMMFLYFQKVRPTVCLIEVGLGGLYDSTNVVDANDVIITTIGIDHTDKLGTTLGEIAQQKAGIIHSQADVYIGDLPPTATDIMIAKCQKEQADLYQLTSETTIDIHQQSLDQGTYFSLNNQAYHIQLLGEHQVHNAALALLCFRYWMNKHHFIIDEQKAKIALSTTTWLGRMEKISEQPVIFIDGAHNEAGLIALQQTIGRYLSNQKIKLIYAGLKTKKHARHLELLKQMPVESVYLTTFNHFQAMKQTDFSELSSLTESMQYCEDWRRLLSAEDEVIVVTGSLYFVAEVRQWIYQ